MEIPWLLLGLISAAAAAFISKIIKTRGWRPEQKLRPPGPKPWPIIGNLNLLGSTPHRSLHHLSQKYGEIMLLKLGKFPVVVASSPEMARQFLKVHDAAFASRPTFAAYKHVSFEYSDVSFSPYGPYWREVRKIVVTKVLSARKIDSFKHTRVEERRLLLSRLKSLSGKPVELREHLSRFTLSIICKMLFKEESIVDMDEVSVMVREWFLLNGAFNIGDWIPWLDSLDLQGHIKKMKALRKKMDRFCDSVIDDHLARRVAAGDDAAKKDFVDALLQIAAEEDGVEFTMDCVKALIMGRRLEFEARRGAAEGYGRLDWHGVGWKVAILARRKAADGCGCLESGLARLRWNRESRLGRAVEVRTVDGREVVRSGLVWPEALGVV